MTLALGLAIVSIYARLAEYFNEIPVDLPVVESDSPIIVEVPTERKPFNIGGGGG